MLDWEDANTQILRCEGLYYKVCLTRNGIKIYNGMTVTFGPSYYYILRNNRVYEAKSYNYQILLHTENPYDILYVAYCDDKNNSKYDYRTARKIYDGSKETDLMTEFRQFDIKFSYLSL